MRSWVKLLVALVVTLPIVGYVAGAVVSTTPADQGPLPPVLMRDDVTPTDPDPIRSTPRQAPEPVATKTPAPAPQEDDDDEVRVVRPEPTRVDDGDDGDDEGDDEGDDDGDEDGDDRSDDRSDDDSDDGGDD